jgi:hypothetical protein
MRQPPKFYCVPDLRLRYEDIGSFEIFLEPMANKDAACVQHIAKFQVGSPLMDKSMPRRRWRQVFGGDSAKSGYIILGAVTRVTHTCEITDKAYHDGFRRKNVVVR